MQRNDLVHLLNNVLLKKTMHMPQDAGESIPSAVLVIIHYHSSGRPFIILTKRSSTLKSHKSEISFPGGKHALGDATLLETALRETQEEIGVTVEPSDIIGSLSVVRTMTSNHYIVPFLTVQDKIVHYEMSAIEVEEILDAPLVETLQTMRPDEAHFMLSKNACQFTYGTNVIWGATARILKQLFDLLIRPS